MGPDRPNFTKSGDLVATELFDENQVFHIISQLKPLLFMWRAFCIFLFFSKCHLAIPWPSNSQPGHHQPDQPWVWPSNGQPMASHWPGRWPIQYLRRIELNGIYVKLKLRWEFKVSAKLELEASGQTNGQAHGLPLAMASHWPGQWPIQYLRRIELNGIYMKWELK